MGSNVAKLVTCIILVCISALSETGFALAQTEPETVALARASQFTSQVVRVVPVHIDGSEAEVGFGLIVGQMEGKIYIATPYHVVFGRDRPSSLSDTLEIVFQGSPYHGVTAKRLGVASPETRDNLAVLEVDSPAGMTLPRAPLVKGTQLLRGTWVWNIGINQSWDMPDRAGGLGLEDVLNHRRRVGGLRTPPGGSGGAAVTEYGVIGIVLSDAWDYSLILPIERIVSLFQSWNIPVNLLILPGELDEASKTAPKAPTSTQQRPWKLFKALCYYSGNCSRRCYYSANCSE